MKRRAFLQAFGLGTVAIAAPVVLGPNRIYSFARKLFVPGYEEYFTTVDCGGMTEGELYQHLKYMTRGTPEYVSDFSMSARVRRHPPPKPFEQNGLIHMPAQQPAQGVFVQKLGPGNKGYTLVDTKGNVRAPIIKRERVIRGIG